MKQLFKQLNPPYIRGVDESHDERRRARVCLSVLGDLGARAGSTPPMFQQFRPEMESAEIEQAIFSDMSFNPGTPSGLKVVAAGDALLSYAEGSSPRYLVAHCTIKFGLLSYQR
jgi:hypothetical protein